MVKKFLSLNSEILGTGTNSEKLKKLICSLYFFVLTSIITAIAVNVTKDIQSKSLFLTRPTIGHYFTSRNEIQKGADEIFEKINELDCIVVPIGGGGLISGISIVAKKINPKIKIFGVESDLYPSAYNKFKKKNYWVIYNYIYDCCSYK